MKQKNNLLEKYDWMISYQGTATTPEEREGNFSKIINYLEGQGKSVFCSEEYEEFIEENKMTVDQNYHFCLQAQERTDSMLFFINKEIESLGVKKEGVLAEKLGQRKTLLIRKDLTNIPGAQVLIKGSDEVIYFEGDFRDFDMERIGHII